MPLQTSSNGSVVTIRVAGRLDFSCHREFRNSYQNASKDSRFVIDMTTTDYVDSSALGMLLLLREHAGGDSADVRIVTGGAGIKKILSTMNFQRLFKID